MSAKIDLKWLGDKVDKDTRERVAKALNTGAAIGVQFAQENSPRDTGFMANTMEVVKQADSHKLEVQWGNQTAKYTIWVEIGARGRAGVRMITRSLDPAIKAVKSALS